MGLHAPNNKGNPMPTITSGTPVWHALTTKNAAELVPFYEAVCNWTASDHDMGDYVDFDMTTQSGERVAGLCHAGGDNAALPPVWMIANQLWLVLLCYFAVIASLIAGFGLLGVADYWLGYASLALSLLIGFEADSLRRWTLDRRAYRQIASVTGATNEECERRFFSEWLPTVPDVSPSSFTPPGTEGGLDTSTSDAATAPLSGSVIPPNRTGWRSAPPWRSA